MGEIVATAKCYNPECGGTMEGRKSDYQYTECGLSSVYLKDILVFFCPKCSAVVPEIPAAGVLHRVIALRLLGKRTLLSGSEMRFMRKLLGKSITELVEIMGVANKSVISRWENKSPGKDMDRIMRLLVASQLAGELVGNKKPLLQNVTAEQLLKDIQGSLKIIEAKERNDERFFISPADLEKFGGESRCEEPVTAIQ